MCVMPWVMSMEVRNIVVDVVDNDRTMSSQLLVHDIEASNYFIFHGQQPTYQAALADIETGKADVVLVIPQDYSRDLTMGRQPQVLIAANAVNGTKGSMGSAYLSQIVTAHALPEAATIQSKVSTLLLYNKHQNYKVFMIPALFAIVMMLMTGFLPTLNIVGEKEAGTIEQINVTPVSKWAFILSKLIPYWLIALFVITAGLLLAFRCDRITVEKKVHRRTLVALSEGPLSDGGAYQALWGGEEGRRHDRGFTHHQAVDQTMDRAV